MKNETKVYVLIDPNTLKVRYIGITCQSLRDRLGNHIHDARYRELDNYHKAKWIQSLLSENKRPIIKQIKLCSTRIEAEVIESAMILKYKIKHNLVNISEGNGEFTSKGQYSASEVNSKKVYVYTYNGKYYGTYNSHIECSEELNIYVSCIEKCLRGEYKYAKGFQFSHKKLDKMESLENYSTGSSKEVILLDNESGETLRFKSGVDCKNKLNLKFSSSGHKYILGALNKQYGNKYSMLVDGEFIQSTYYNTGVSIKCKNKEYKFISRKELLKFMGFKIKSIDEDKLYEYIYNYFDNIEEVILNQPLCLVTDKDN